MNVMRSINKFRVFAAAANMILLSLLASNGATTNLSLLITTNSWKYSDAGINYGTVWSQTNYDDSTWTNHRAVFYTDTATPPVNAKTLLALGPSTYYFRAHFVNNSVASLVTLSSSSVFDDGAVVYINGIEALRVGMPAGAISYSTLATRAAGNSISEIFSLPATNLVIGDNVVAVELHQNADLTDVAFGMSLNATVTYTNSSRLAVLLNEVLANNRTQTNANGFTADWVELYNPSLNPIDLSDMSLSTSISAPRNWIFPPGSSIPAQGYLVIDFDPDSPVSSINTGFKISAGSDSVYLFERPSNGGGVVDSISFGPQAGDFSIGRVPNGSTNWVLNQPTRRAANVAATLGSPATLKVNEWVAHSIGDGDWFEICNPAAQPVLLSGLYLSKGPLPGTTFFPVPALSFIGVGPSGYVQYHADKGTAANHVNFRLGSMGDTVSILASDAATVINTVTFGVQTNHIDVSEGRFPDGTANIVVFWNSTSPEEPNWLPLTNAVINEVLSHTDPPIEDAVEIYNPTGSPTDISGWFLSNSIDDLKKFRFPSGTIIPARGYKVIYEYQFNTTNGGTIPFTFNSAHGDACHLSQADALGNLSSFRSSVSFGAAEHGVSFGRYQTSVGFDFPAMSQNTFGVDNPANLTQFRMGTGLPNNYPKVGPVVINEIMYHPPSIVGTNDNTQDEFIELLNITSSAVPLYDPSFPTNHWKFDSGVTFVFPPNVSIAANSNILVVPFDPVSNPTALASFRSKYSVPAGVPVYGPYTGKLNNLGESLELYRPDTPQAPPHPDAGYVPYILVDQIHYLNVPPWPTTADGSGPSLQRRNPANYGNDPVNWAGVAPTAGRDNGLRTLVAPSITTQPQNQNVTPGSIATFSATASGSAPLQYQWRLNGTNLSGITNNGFMILNVQAANAGPYTVVITNSAGSITSIVATLTLAGGAPSITQQPSSLTVTQGNMAAFSVTASGTALSYQWRFNGSGIAGATGSNYVIASAQSTNAGNYDVIVTNNAGSVTSTVATLTVRIPPSITQQPSSLTVTQGNMAAFSVTASGTTLSYQWRFNGGGIAGATGSNYVIASAQATNAGNYDVIVSNNAGSITSAVATLTVNVPPSITAQPQSLTVPAGSNATFSVTASGTVPLTYQWRFNNTNLTGAIGTNYTVTNVQTSNAGSYTVVITNVAGSVTSAVAVLTMASELRLNYQLFTTNSALAVRISPRIAQPYSLEASMNLTNWVSIFTNQSGATGADYTQTAITNFPHRFFRGKRWP